MLPPDLVIIFLFGSQSAAIFSDSLNASTSELIPKKLFSDL